MELKWIFLIFMSWIVIIDCVPIEYVYTSDGCECPTRLGYQINVPKLPKPKRVVPSEHGYKIDVPPMQAKAKVSYTFDFSVEEPRPPRPEKESKLDLYAKVDRISLNREDCPEAYAAPPPPPPLAPPPSAPCRCGHYGSSKPIYRYVNGKWITNKCKCPKCKCHLRRRKPTPIADSMASAIGTPIVVASGPLARSKNSIRRKRDLRSIFFRPRHQYLSRPARYVKLYNKNIPKEKQQQLPQQGWFDMDLFSEANPFKRKTKKFLFPHTGARIVKRDIKGEYDMLEKEHEAADLTLPEIIQFMPETLQPNFKRGPCQFGCSKTQQIKNSEEIDAATKKSDADNDELTTTTTQSLNTGDDTTIDNMENDENNAIDTITTPSYRKRNAGIYEYEQAAAPPSAYITQNVYAAEIDPRQLPSPSATNPNYDSAVTAPQSPCEQRKMYAEMRRRADQAATEYPHDDRLGHKYNQEDQRKLRVMVAQSSTVPDPFGIGAAPLHYAGDLEIPPPAAYGAQSQAGNPMVGATQYPVQHISSALLDRIITDIVYRHPAFIDATSHYGGALVDPEPYQEQQTKDFVKKLIDGRFGLLFSEPDDQFRSYYPAAPDYSGQSYNPYVQHLQPRTYNYYPPAMY